MTNQPVPAEPPTPAPISHNSYALPDAPAADPDEREWIVWGNAPWNSVEAQRETARRRRLATNQ